MSVHYKFKSALEYDTVTFDGLHISVRDLKKAIVHQKRIGKSTDFDLQVTNAQTKEVYTDDNALIAKNTSLIIARVPLTVQQKKAWDRSEANQLREGKCEGDGQDPSMNRMSKTLDLANLDASEEDKILAMMSQSTQDYNPSNYMKIRGSNQMGEVPANYRCYKCHQPGHWIKNCPLGSNQEPVEIKKSTGIPRSFMVPVDGPGEPGAMMTPSGGFAVPAVDHQAYKEGKRERPPFQAEPEQVATKPEIPEDLLCSVCMDLLTDAVMVPCCGVSFCDECIRTVLIDSEDHECPDCQSKSVSPNTLIPNRYLRTAVNNFRNKTGYVKPRQRLSTSSDTAPTVPPAVVIAPTAEVTSDQVPAEALKRGAASETAGGAPLAVEAAGEPPLEGRPITQLEHRPRSHGEPHHLPPPGVPPPGVGHHPLGPGPPGTRPHPGYLGPPGPPGIPMTGGRPMPMPLPPHIQPHHSGYPHAGPLRRSMEDRPGTPTIDERLDALPDTSVPPPNCIPPVYQPPVLPPQGIYQHELRNYGPGPQTGSGYEPAHMLPYHHDPSLGPHYPGAEMDGRGGYRPGYRGRSRGTYPAGPYRAGNATAPTTRLPSNGTQPGGPPAVIEDTLAVFERMLREKDARDRKRRARRSRSRSYTPRSRSRTYSRSRTRTPPRKRERSRSRSFTISRSRSRSYSRSPGPRPVPRERERERTREREPRDREREYSPHRRSERFRSPHRSPTRYHHPVPAGRGRDFDYAEPEFPAFPGRNRGGGGGSGVDQRYGGVGGERKDKEYFNNLAGGAIRYPPEEPRYPRVSPPRDIHSRPAGPPGVRYDRYNNPIVSSIRNYDGLRSFDGPQRPFNGPRPFDGPPRHFDGPQRPYDGPPINQRPYDGPPMNQRPYDDGPMNQRPYEEGPANQRPYDDGQMLRPYDAPPSQRPFDGPPASRPYDANAPNQRPFERRFDAFDEAPPGTGPDLPIPGAGSNRYERNFERNYELTPPGEDRPPWDLVNPRERDFYEREKLEEEQKPHSPLLRKVSREREERRERDERRGGEREERRGRDEKRVEKDEKKPVEREDKRMGERDEKRVVEKEGRGSNRDDKRGGERDGKRGGERDQYGVDREERRIGGREEKRSEREDKRGYERSRRNSGKDEKRVDREEKYGKEREDKRTGDRDEKRVDRDSVRSNEKDEKRSKSSGKEVQKENVPEQKEVKDKDQDAIKEGDQSVEKDRKKDEKKSKERKKKKKEKGDDDKKKKKRKGKKDGVEKKTEKKDKDKQPADEKAATPEVNEAKPEPSKEPPVKAEPQQSLYDDMEDAPIDTSVIATYKEVHETEGKVDERLAPLPELSKWEMEDEFTSPSEKKPGESHTPDSASKMVTSEVLKRAENAIFQKAINAIRPSDQGKKGGKPGEGDAAKPERERKEPEPAKNVERERKGEAASSRDRNRDEQPRTERDRKEAKGDRDRKDAGKSDRERTDSKLADEYREARKTGNSIQITIPVEIPALMDMALVPPPKLKSKLDRSKFSTANWTHGEDLPSPARVSAKDRLGARVDDAGRKAARDQARSGSGSPPPPRKVFKNTMVEASPPRKVFKSSVESTLRAAGSGRPHSPLGKVFRSSVEAKFDGRSKEGSFRPVASRSPHRARRTDRPEGDRWKEDRRHEKSGDRRATEDERRRHGSRERRDASQESRETEIVKEDAEEKVAESSERKGKDEEKIREKEERKKEEKHKAHKRGEGKTTRKKSTSDKERKRKDKKHKKLRDKDKKKEKLKDEDKKDTDPLEERELAANPERESDEQVVAKDPGEDSAKKVRKADRKKSTLDEASFEPDYDISTEADTEDEGEKKTVSAPPKEEVKVAAKKRSRSHDSESSSSSDSSSESSDHHRKRHKRRKHKKTKKSTTEGSSSGSESNDSSSESDGRKRKSKKHHKRSKTKNPETTPLPPVFFPSTNSWSSHPRIWIERPHQRILYPPSTHQHHYGSFRRCRKYRRR